LPPLRPCGTARSIALRSAARSSGRSLARRLVCTAIIPQPMSTPTAAGITAPTVGITLPTVAPIPKCTSGIATTQPWMNGRLAALVSCARASASNGTPRVHAFTGTPPELDHEALRRAHRAVASITSQIAPVIRATCAGDAM
jgi:hypothetical protein